MIRIAYCKTCGIVVAVNVSGAIHYHEVLGVEVPEDCVVIGVSESMPSVFPHRTGAGTMVTNTQQWYTYLAKYIPAAL